MFVAPLAEFLRRHPRVTVEWRLQDEARDLIGAGIDCAIQVGEPSDPSVVAIKLSEVARFVVAAPSVLQGLPPPQDPAALANLPWLALRPYYRNEVTLSDTHSSETRQFPIRPVLGTDSLYALRSAARLGLGACIASAWLLQEDLAQGRLLHLAPRWRAAPLPVYLVYPHARHYPARLRHFVALMRERVPAVIDRAG